MDYKTITYTVQDDKVAILTLNRANSFNAISRELALEIIPVLQQAEQDDQVRALVLTGAGKAFCAGGDLAWLMASDTTAKKREILDLASRIITTMNRFEKPLIAAVNGVAAGAGTAVALACDMVIASEKAAYAPNFVNIGALPDSGASWFLPRTVGYHKAVELMLTGQVINANQALQLGIFNKVTPEQDLLPTALGLAAKLAAGPQDAIKAIKKMLKLSAQNSLATQLEVEASLQLVAFSSDDFNEGVQAFLQNRKPNFNTKN